MQLARQLAAGLDVAPALPGYPLEGTRIAAKAVARTSAGNLASQAVLSRCGFSPLGGLSQPLDEGRMVYFELEPAKTSRAK